MRDGWNNLNELCKIRLQIIFLYSYSNDVTDVCIQQIKFLSSSTSYTLKKKNNAY